MKRILLSLTFAFCSFQQVHAQGIGLNLEHTVLGILSGGLANTGIPLIDSFFSYQSESDRRYGGSAKERMKEWIDGGGYGGPARRGAGGQWWNDQGREECKQIVREIFFKKTPSEFDKFITWDPANKKERYLEHMARWHNNFKCTESQQKMYTDTIRKRWGI